MSDGRMAALCARLGLGEERKVRAPRRHGAGQHPARATLGKVPQKHTAEPVPSFRGRRAARVKWCGKSAPRRRQRRRQGKPHREQDQVGAAGGNEPRLTPPGGPSAPPLGSVARGVRRRTSQMNGHPRLRTGQNPAYRPSGLVVLFGTYRELNFVEDAEYLSPRLHHVATSIE